MVLFSDEANLSQSYRLFIKTHPFSPSPHVLSFSERGIEKGFNSGDFLVMLPVSACCYLPVKWDLMLFFSKKPAGVSYWFPFIQTLPVEWEEKQENTWGGGRIKIKKTPTKQ